MTGIENIDPGDSEPMAPDVLSIPRENDTARVDLDSASKQELLDAINRSQTLQDVFDFIDEWGPAVGMMAVPIPGFRGLGVARGAKRVSRAAGSLSAKAGSHSPAKVGRAVAKARRSLRRVNPRRPGVHRQAASPPPLKRPDADRFLARQSGQPGPAEIRGGISSTPADRLFQGAAARGGSPPRRTVGDRVLRRSVNTGKPHKRPLTGGELGIMKLLGGGPAARGTVRSIGQAATIAGAASYVGPIAFAVAEGLAARFSGNLKENSTGGEGSSPASDAATARAIDDAMTEAMRGNVQEAEDIMVGAGIEQRKVTQALDAAQQARQEQNPSPTTQPEQPPGRTLQQQVDSLAEQANQPGLPPTAQMAIEGQHNAAQGLALAEEQAQLANEGRLPPVYVSEGIDFANQRSNLRRVNQVLGDIFDMEQPELVDLQHKLFAAGFYGARNYDSIRFGAKDPATMTAFQGFLEQAAQKTNRAIAQVGEGFGSTQEGNIAAPTGISSWRNTLEKWATEAGGVEEAMDSDPDPTFVVSLTDPESIKSQLNKLSQSVIGRGISPRAEQRFVSMFHSQQREAQLAAQRAQQQSREAELQGQRNRAMALREMQRETGAQAQQPQSQPSPGEQVVEVTQPSVAGQAQSFLESEFPTEAGAFSTVKSYNDFLEIIGA